MSSSTNSRPTWLRWIINTNPFYLVSVGLVLIGLQLSFANTETLGPDWPWQLLQLLAGYTLALAATSILIVRLGHVWDDARTIILLTILLFVALSAGFDRVCLDDWRRGGQLLMWGLGFSIAVTELVLRHLELRLPTTMRGALYSQLSLLFAMPIWLGYLSLSGQDERMATWVVLFPALAGLALVTLVLPAARGPADVRCPGNWIWPLYPFSAFVIVAVGFALRSWGLTVSFELARGIEAGFLPYFLLPILASAIAVLLELLRRGHAKFWRLAATCLPALLLLLVFPGSQLNAPQLSVLARYQQLLGAPAQIAVVLAMWIYARCWWSGCGPAGWGFAASLGFASLLDRYTVSWATLSTVQQFPLWCLIVGLAIRAIWTDHGLSMLIACLLALADVAYLAGLDSLGKYLVIHAAIGILILAPIGFSGALGRWARRNATWIIAVLSVSGASFHSALFPDVAGVVYLAMIALLVALATGFWLRDRQIKSLRHATICLGAAATRLVLEALLFFARSADLVGRKWLVWGFGLLLLALAISLIKGGIRARIESLLAWFNRVAQRL